MSGLSVNLKPIFDSLKPTVFDFPDWVLNTPLVVSHGLGIVPIRVEVVNYCKVSDAGFSVGAELIPSASNNGFRGVFVMKNETEIRVNPRWCFPANYVGNNYFVIQDSSKWGIRVRIWE